MLDGLSPAVVQGGAVVTLGLVFLTLFGAIWKGLLFTKPGVEKMLELQEKRVQEAIAREKEWRDVATAWQATAQEAIGQKEDLMEQGRTVIALINSIPRRGGR